MPARCAGVRPANAAIDEPARHAVLDRLAAAGDVGRDDRPARGRRLEQNVAHALVPARQHDAVAGGVKRRGVRPEAAEHGDPVADQRRDGGAVVVLEEADDLDPDAAAVGAPEPPGRLDELVHALLAHDAAQIEKADGRVRVRIRGGSAGIGAGTGGAAVEVYARAGQGDRPGGVGDAAAEKFHGVRFVLEEDGPCAAQGAAVHDRHKTRKTPPLKRRAEALDVRAAGDAQPAADRAGVDVRFDGVRDDEVGLLAADEPAIEAQKRQITRRIDAPAIQRRLDHAAAHRGEIRLAADKRRADRDAAQLEQRPDQLPPELPEHIGVVCDDEKRFLTHTRPS